jgi:hypothetical protein
MVNPVDDRLIWPAGIEVPIIGPGRSIAGTANSGSAIPGVGGAVGQCRHLAGMGHRRPAHRRIVAARLRTIAAARPAANARTTVTETISVFIGSLLGSNRQRRHLACARQPMTWVTRMLRCRFLGTACERVPMAIPPLNSLRFLARNTSTRRLARETGTAGKGSRRGRSRRRARNTLPPSPLPNAGRGSPGHSNAGSDGPGHEKEPPSQRLFFLQPHNRERFL